MSKLFSAYTVKNIELKNRIVMPPMCMYSAGDEGFANDFHFVHYTTRAVGGAALLIFEATAIERRGRITANDLGLWDDAQIEPLKRIVNEIKKYGAKAAVQLAHAGRKCGAPNEETIAPSAVAFSDRYPVPAEMTKEDIKAVIEAFKNAAVRAEKAGFDMIEIHAAHGYLINEFLSPLSNKRTDEYGGNLENRARILKEVLDEVKKVWKDKPILVRVSAEEFQPEGNHAGDTAEILNSVKDKIDLVDVSTGGVVLNEINLYPGYQIQYAEIIKKETGLPVIGGGLLSEPGMIEAVLQDNRCDMVFLGRELLRNPYFPLHAASAMHEEFEWPKQYKRSKI